MNTKVAFIVNSSRKLNRSSHLAMELALNNDNLNCEIFKTESSQHGIDLAKTITDKGFDIIVAVGGDGTCNEVVNGIQLSDNKQNVAFGLIPNGTGNDFQKMLGNFNPKNFVNSLNLKKSKQIDLIKIESPTFTKYAINIAGIGFDGHVVNVLWKFRNRTFLRGKFAYILAILKSFIGFKSTVTTISSDEFSYSGKTLMLVVCNGMSFGHGLIINPNAKIEDGVLEITLLGNVSFLDYIKNVSKLKRGIKIVHPQVYYFSSKSIEISMEENELFTEADGEIVGQGNMKYSIMPAQLKLIY